MITVAIIMKDTIFSLVIIFSLFVGINNKIEDTSIWFNTDISLHNSDDYSGYYYERYSHFS